MSMESLDIKRYTGIQYYLSSILNNLDEKQINDITLISPYNTQINYQYITKKYKTIQLNLTGPSQNSLWFGLGGKFLEQYSFDTYIGSTFSLPDYLPPNVKKISFFYDTIPLQSDFIFNYIGYKQPFNNLDMIQSLVLSKQYDEKALKTQDIIVTISNTVKDELHNEYNVPLEKIKVIYPNVDTSFFKYTSNVGILQKYGITGPYFLMLNTSESYHKRVQYVINAFKHAIINDNVKLVIGGQLNAQELNSIKSALSSKFIYVDYIDKNDLPTIYSNALAYVSAVYKGGFDLPTLEALQCDTRVFASDIPLHHEILGKEQDYYKLDYNDRTDLSALFTKYGVIPKQTITSKVTQKFSIQNTIDSFLSMIYN